MNAVMWGVPFCIKVAMRSFSPSQPGNNHSNVTPPSSFNLLRELVAGDALVEASSQVACLCHGLLFFSQVLFVAGLCCLVFLVVLFEGFLAGLHSCCSLSVVFVLVSLVPIRVWLKMGAFRRWFFQATQRKPADLVGCRFETPLVFLCACTPGVDQHRTAGSAPDAQPGGPDGLQMGGSSFLEPRGLFFW